MPSTTRLCDGSRVVLFFLAYQGGNSSIAARVLVLGRGGYA